MVLCVLGYEYHDYEMFIQRIPSTRTVTQKNQIFSEAPQRLSNVIFDVAIGH